MISTCGFTQVSLSAVFFFPGRHTHANVSVGWIQTAKMCKQWPIEECVSFACSNHCFMENNHFFVLFITLKCKHNGA